jgi:hypothetical protein
MVELLQEGPVEADIYFFGGERMRFDSIPSLEYLLPERSAVSVSQTENFSLPVSLSQTTYFIVLPDERPILESLAKAYPQSSIIARYNRHGRLLFYVRTVEHLN